MWQPRGEPFFIKMAKTRGSSITILGALSNFGQIFARLGDRTNQASVLDFMVALSHAYDLRDSVLVCDNHSAHWAKVVRTYAESQGCELMYLPPMSSFMNPVETVWAEVKK